MQKTPALLHESLDRPWRITGGGAYDAPQGRDFPPHSHRQWEWVYYRSGFIQSVHGGERINTRPGVLWLTPPDVAHAEIALTAYSNLFFEVEGPTDIELPKIVQDDADAALGNLLKLILRELQHRDADSARVIALLTQTLVLQIDRLRRHSLLQKNQLRIRDAEALWEDRPLLSVERVAGELGISVSGLRQLFYEQCHCSPIDFRTRLRVGRAVRMLYTSTAKLDAIAGLCGFNSASHLARHVKAVTGKSSGELRG